jgi:hypothetical protein
VKVKVSLSTDEGIWGNGGTTQLIFNLGSRCRQVVSFTPRPLNYVKTSYVHWIEGWVVSRAGLDALEKREMLLLPGFEPRFVVCPARCLVTIPSTLPRVLYVGSVTFLVKWFVFRWMEFRNFMLLGAIFLKTLLEFIHRVQFHKHVYDFCSWAIKHTRQRSLRTLSAQTQAGRGVLCVTLGRETNMIACHLHENYHRCVCWKLI